MPRKLVVIQLAMLASASIAVVSVGLAQAQPIASQQPIADTTLQARALRARQAEFTRLRIEVQHNRNLTWYWQDVMQKPHARVYIHKAKGSKLQNLKHLAVIWWRILHYVQYKAQHPPHLSDWLCIHSHEGAWNDDTGNGYYGGLQMNWTFMSTYAPDLLGNKGPASNWTPLQQIWVAENAAFIHHRGFYPWPKTARMCGLI